MTLTEWPWTQQGFPILLVLQLLPLLGVGVMRLLRHTRASIPVALTLGVLQLGLTFMLYLAYDAKAAALQFSEHLALLGPFDYHVAVDGVSILFLLLTALLTLLVFVYGRVRDLVPAWRLAAAVFGVQFTLTVIFTTLSLLWFVVFSTLELGLVSYLLWHWATSPDKDLVLVRFYQFMGTGVLLLLLGTLLIGWYHTQVTAGRWSFDLLELQRVPIGPGLSSTVFFLLFYGLAIRTPLFPLHGWLPLVAEHGNIAVAPTLLLGLKVGIYGLLRFVFPLLPEAVTRWQGYVVAFAVVGIFYAALLAMVQVNLRRLLAYAVVSHTSLLIVGLFCLEGLAFQGSVILSVTFGLALATLAFMTGLIYRRTHTTLLSKLGGLFDQIPLVGGAFLVAGLSIIGMPGTPGFDAAHLVLEASIQRFGALVTIAAALGNVVAAGFLLWAFQRAFLAPRSEALPKVSIAPISRPEGLVSGLVVLVLLGTGFYTQPWLELIETPLERLGALFVEER